MYEVGGLGRSEARGVAGGDGRPETGGRGENLAFSRFGVVL